MYTAITKFSVHQYHLIHSTVSHHHPIHFWCSFHQLLTHLSVSHHHLIWLRCGGFSHHLTPVWRGLHHRPFPVWSGFSHVVSWTQSGGTSGHKENRRKISLCCHCVSVHVSSKYCDQWMPQNRNCICNVSHQYESSCAFAGCFSERNFFHTMHRYGTFHRYVWPYGPSNFRVLWMFCGRFHNWGTGREAAQPGGLSIHVAAESSPEQNLCHILNICGFSPVYVWLRCVWRDFYHIWTQRRKLYRDMAGTSCVCSSEGSDVPHGRMTCHMLSRDEAVLGRVRSYAWSE